MNVATKLKNSHIFSWLGIYFLLLAIYLQFISYFFEYAKFGKEFSIIKFTIALVTTVLIVLSISGKRILAAYQSLMLLFIFVPSMVLFSAGGLDYTFYITTTAACFLVMIFSTYLQLPSIRFFSLKSRDLYLLLLGFIALYFGILILNGGLSYFNLDLRKVYEFRELAEKNMPWFWPYLSPLVEKVIVPVLLVISLSKRKWGMAIVAATSSVMIFAFTSHKSPLFFPFFIAFVYWIYERGLVKFMLYGVGVLLALSWVDFYLAGDQILEFGWFGSLISRRLILVPSLLNDLHIQYFSENPLYLWSKSKFSFGLVSSQYDLSIAKQIGYAFFGTDKLAANTGWIGSGFANGGFIGVALYSVLIGILLNYFASLSKYVGEKLIFSTSSILVMTILLSTDLSTALLTHGLLYLVFIYLVLPRREFD